MFHIHTSKHKAITYEKMRRKNGVKFFHTMFRSRENQIRNSIEYI